MTVDVVVLREAIARALSLTRKVDAFRETHPEIDSVSRSDKSACSDQCAELETLMIAIDAGVVGIATQCRARVASDHPEYRLGGVGTFAEMVSARWAPCEDSDITGACVFCTGKATVTFSTAESKCTSVHGCKCLFTTCDTCWGRFVAAALESNVDRFVCSSDSECGAVCVVACPICSAPVCAFHVSATCAGEEEGEGEEFFVVDPVDVAGDPVATFALGDDFSRNVQNVHDASAQVDCAVIDIANLAMRVRGIMDSAVASVTSLSAGKVYPRAKPRAIPTTDLKRVSKRCCGVCRKPGHYRPQCPVARSTKEEAHKP